MKTGEYLTGGKPPKGEGRPVKAPKPAKRSPSGSKTPVTPLPGPGKRPKAHIGVPGGKVGGGQANDNVTREVPKGYVLPGDKRPKPKKPKPASPKSSSAAVASVASASTAKKTGKRPPAPGTHGSPYLHNREPYETGKRPPAPGGGKKPKPGRRIGGPLTERRLRPPGKFEDKGKGKG